MIHYTREVSTVLSHLQASWLDYLSHPPSLAGGGRLSGLKAGKIATRAIQDTREEIPIQRAMSPQATFFTTMLLALTVRYNHERTTVLFESFLHCM